MQECLSSIRPSISLEKKTLLTSLSKDASSKQLGNLYSLSRSADLVDSLGNFIFSPSALTIELVVIFLLTYNYYPGILSIGLFFAISFLQENFSGYFRLLFSSFLGIRSLSDVIKKFAINIPTL